MLAEPLWRGLAARGPLVAPPVPAEPPRGLAARLGDSRTDGCVVCIRLARSAALVAAHPCNLRLTIAQCRESDSRADECRIFRRNPSFWKDHRQSRGSLWLHLPCWFQNPRTQDTGEPQASYKVSRRLRRMPPLRSKVRQASPSVPATPWRQGLLESESRLVSHGQSRPWV